MQTSIIDAILHLVANPVVQLVQTYKSNNRANSAGVALELYIQDLFTGAFNMPETQRQERVSEVFSYTGNQNNPPDAMLRGGDAIEVKKIETSSTADLALNSSYPKRTLRADNPMITRYCREAEDWTEKDMLYVVGHIDKGKRTLRSLAMVYGLDYCASEEAYAGLKKRIQDGVAHIDGVNLSETKELGRLNRVDPLGITYLRMRGMWGIANPWSVFSYIYERDKHKDFNFMCIINSEKWRQLPKPERLLELSRSDPRLKISDVKIKDPNNPARLNDAKLIQFSI